MDSMRSLNSSLPTSTPLSNKPQSPEQLLQAFKSAALSVTNLYKSAVADHSDARQQGYQDALEDLLVFLDKENLGLMDGEGWKVRQWATERYNRVPGTANISDNEEDAGDEDNRARSSSPVRPQTQEPLHHSRHPSPAKPDSSEQLTPGTQTQNRNAEAAYPPMFTFTAGPSVSLLDADMSNPEQQTGSTTSEQGSHLQVPGKLSDAPMRVEVVAKGSRTPHRHGNSSRSAHRSATRDLHFNNGTKRKLQFADFFDLSNLGNTGQGKDSTGGGSKRGRLAL